MTLFLLKNHNCCYKLNKCFFNDKNFCTEETRGPFSDCGFTCSKWFYFDPPQLVFGLVTSFWIWISLWHPLNTITTVVIIIVNKAISQMLLLWWASALQRFIYQFTEETQFLCWMSAWLMCGLKWEMMLWSSVQSPGLEISIWVMAHKHLPNCIQPSVGMSSEVMEVIRSIHRVGDRQSDSKYHTSVSIFSSNLSKWKGNTFLWYCL